MFNLKQHNTRRHAMAAVAAATLASLGAAPAATAGEWTPKKPVEMVVMAGQGGGADRLARLFQSMIQKNKLSPMPVLPVNKGGGSGAEALRYLKEKGGDAHVVMATLNSYYTTPLRQDIGVDIEEFTPLARMAVDTFVLWVNADSGITSLDEWVAAVKAKGGAWKMGGTGSGQEDSLITDMLKKEFGLEITYVPFKGGGTVAKNLVGGHIDSSVNNPSEALPFSQAGKVIPLATFTAERIPALPETPTMTELGHSLEYYMQRSFVGPADMPADAVAYYTDMFTQLSKLPEWQEYADNKALFTDFLTGDELQAYFVEQRTAHAGILGLN